MALTTAEIAEAVRTCAAFADPRSAQRCIDAADRLMEQDAEVTALRGRSVCVDCGSPMVARCVGCEAIIG